MSARSPLTGREPLLAALERHRVGYIVIGGAAAEARGWRGRTVDIDIVPSPDVENLDRLAAALNELGARIAVGPDEPGGLPAPGGFDRDLLASSAIWNLTTPHGLLDIAFKPSGTDGYADLVRHATQALVPGSDRTILVASSADIIRSKTAAARAKDLAVLPQLHAELDQHPGTRP
ncbi:MAG TPA: hypothetical protein VED41_03005 [Solirubrobacteraceae bacterium]|nr:hypothetical protein [Solirubrobacteraceae bacterium]